MVKLYRPVGLQELALIWDSGCHEFPPRLPEQPIFYPVTSAAYAAQIARDWNTKASGFAGYVTSFNVDDDYLSKFERHIVGSAIHEEYWVPSELLPEFNRAIVGAIEVESAFFGDSFVGFVPAQGGFKGKNAHQQFEILAHSLDYSLMDFALEISVNPKAVYLNCLFWLERDFSMVGIAAELKRAVIMGAVEAWARSNTNPGLPIPVINAYSS
jgi:hypothetical protein